MLKPTKMKLLAYVLGALFFMGCTGSYGIGEIYVQKIRESDKSIFSYQAASLINDGYKVGKTILRKNQSVGIGEAEQMPFDFLLGCPTKDTVYTIELEEGGARNPRYISTSTLNHNGIIIKTDKYAYEVGTSNWVNLKFSDFRETEDSLIILELQEDYFNTPTTKNQIGFQKGNIKLVESYSSKGVIKHIEIPAFILKTINNTSIDKLTVIGNDSLDMEGLVYFQFQPTKEIKSNEFSDFGIYKSKEVKDDKVVQ